MQASSQKGMTLLEVLVAFAILSGLVLSVFALMNQNSNYMINAEERLLASVAADNMLTRDLAVKEQFNAGETTGNVDVGGYSFAYFRTVWEIGERGVLIEYQIRMDSAEQTIARASALKANR